MSTYIEKTVDDCAECPFGRWDSETSPLRCCHPARKGTRPVIEDHEELYVPDDCPMRQADVVVRLGSFI